MELVKADRDAMRRIRRLYREAFPADERFSFFLLRRRAMQGRADCWSLMEAGEWVGMAYVLREKDAAYLFYFAIEKNARGRGCGTRALAALKARYAGNRLFLALEKMDPHAENYAQRAKRRAFYQRCGFSALPYQLREKTVVYDLMGVGGPVTPAEYKSMMDAWLGWPLKKIVQVAFLPADGKSGA